MTDFFDDILTTHCETLPHSNVSILDIGCGQGETLCDLYNRLTGKSFSKLKGIAKGDELMSNGEDYNLNSFYRTNGYERKLEHPVFEYEEILVNDFLPNETSRYDLIILSNLLHLLELSEVTAVVNALPNLLTANGTIFILMRNAKEPISNHFKTVLDDGLYRLLNDKYIILYQQEREKSTGLILAAK